MKFKPGLNIEVDFEQMKLIYGEGVDGPIMEKRDIDAIRPSLMDPQCSGPQTVYSIAMDVRRTEDEADLHRRNLLYGIVIYAEGSLGQEPIRSQGHIHAVSASCGQSTPEVYEIWDGEAYIYMQESAKDNPGRCFAVHGKQGDVIIVPPGWAHATISADPSQPLVFGAWCVRDYGFDYVDVRAHGGLTYFPVIDDAGKIEWEKNEAYGPSELTVKEPRIYSELMIEEGKAIYEQYLEERKRFDFVVDPSIEEDTWKGFTP